MRISNFLYPPTIPRCQHIKVNGIQRGSLALKNRKLCHFHQRWQQGRIHLNANRSRRCGYSLDLPVLEDANSIQVALMEGMRLLLTNQVDHRTALFCHRVDTYLARDYTLPSSFPKLRLLFASAVPVRRLWQRFPASQLSVVPMLT